MNNSTREQDAIAAAKVVDPINWEVKPYEALIPPYPVWAAMFACGVARTTNKYKATSTGLFQDEYETCIDLDDKDLQSYFKASALLTSVQQDRSNSRSHRGIISELLSNGPKTRLEPDRTQPCCSSNL